MPIPQFQEFMTPALKALQDGSEKHRSKIEDFVAPILGLTPEERQELLPSGQKPIVRNRLHWALYFMYRAGLVDRPKRATYKITKKGLEALSSNKRIDVKFLETYPQFREFQNISHNNEKNGDVNIPNGNTFDPDESVINAIERANSDTRRDLLERLRGIKETAFEEICLELMKAMGYGIEKDRLFLTKKSHDGGIDGIVYVDALGLDQIYLQEKRYAADNKVNEKEIRDFIGALSTSPVTKGVFFTTSYFSDKAKEKAKAMHASGRFIKLIDGEELVKLMLEYNVGVRVTETYQRKEIDEDFFAEYE